MSCKFKIVNSLLLLIIPILSIADNVTINDNSFWQQFNKLRNEVELARKNKQWRLLGQLKMHAAQFLEPYPEHRMNAGFWYNDASINYIFFNPDSARLCQQKGFNLISFAIANTEKKDSLHYAIENLSQRIWALKKAFTDDGYDQVQAYFLQQHFAFVYHNRMLAFERLHTLGLLTPEEIKNNGVGSDSWFYDLSHCVEHLTYTDKMQAFDIAQLHASVVEILYGRKSLEYFMVLDFLVQRVFKESSARKQIITNYLKLGKIWKDHPRYNNFVKNNFSYVRLSLQSFGIDLSDIELTGPTRYQEIKLDQLGEANVEGKLVMMDDEITQSDLKYLSEKAASNADKLRRNDNYAEAMKWQSQAVKYYIRRIDLNTPETQRMFKYQIRMLGDNMLKIGASKETVSDTLCRILDNLSAINDTIGLQMTQQIAFDWSSDWGTSDSFAKYICNQINKAYDKKREAYWKAVLLRALAGLYVRRTIGYSFLRFMDQDSLAQVLIENAKSPLEKAMRYLDDGMRLIEKAEGRNFRFFDLYSSRMLCVCHSVELGYIDYNEGKQQLEDFLTAIQTIPEYTQHIEFLEVQRIFIQKCCRVASDWSFLRRLAIPLIKKYTVDEVSMKQNSITYRYKHFYDKRLALDPENIMSPIYCGRMWSKRSLEGLSQYVAESYMKQENADSIDIDVVGLYIFQNLISDIKMIQNANFNQNSIDRTLDHCAHLLELCKDDSLMWLGYNTALTCKGIMLYSSKQVEKLASQSNNQEVLSTINRKREATRELNRNYTQIDSNHRKALQSTIHDCEVDLYSKAESLGYLGEMLFQSHTDVAKQLKEGECAVEFLSYSQNDGQKRLCAIVLPGPGESCRYIKLCTESHLLRQDSLYSTDLIKQLIWQPIINICPANLKTIYFSPIDVLHTIAIENVPMNSKGSIKSGNAYRFCRLSNTRELIPANSITGKIGVNHAALLGGINYSSAMSLPTSAQTKKETASTTGKRGAIMGQIDYLPGSEIEIKSIDLTLRNKNLETSVLMNEEATEASFRQLSSTEINLIHIATHGFTEEFEGRDIEEALDHTGLLLSGALDIGENDSKKGYKDNDDGILTAREISDLDFNGVTLATLSACQTAQGTISNEGVFGLQRGFKMAGVKSLLMSLWQVDDEATCLLMTEFYKNWIGEGKTKHDALELAKQSVRSHKEKGWDDPKYWAAFILLDALD